MAQDHATRVQSVFAAFKSSAAGRARPGATLYGTMAIGDSARSADLGAALILDGEKTATSSHPSEYGPSSPAPIIGDLTVLLDGSGAPRAVVETTSIHRAGLDAIDASFARAYGEFDRTVATLRERLAVHFGDALRRDPKLHLERFKLVYVP